MLATLALHLASQPLDDLMQHRDLVKMHVLQLQNSLSRHNMGSREDPMPLLFARHNHVFHAAPPFLEELDLDVANQTAGEERARRARGIIPEPQPAPVVLLSQDEQEFARLTQLANVTWAFRQTKVNR